MNEYAVFYSRDGFGELDVDKPLGAVEHDGTVVTIIGPAAMVDRWRNSFTGPDWESTVKASKEKPLSEFFDRMTYPIAYVYGEDDRDAYDKAVASLAGAKIEKIGSK